MRAGRRGVDVYLLPAVVGGGLGDIEEVLAAGRRLARAGFRVRLYRPAERSLPPSVEGPWSWPTLARVDRVVPSAPAALTVSPAFGVSAAPYRPGPLGRAGPWADEAREIEAAYGPARTLHASLEEFARTLTSLEEARERWREGGVPSRRIPERLRGARHDREVETYREAFERFRAFDRPNVLSLFATFAPSDRFGREFPRAVQVGPLWPRTYRPRRRPARPGRRREWVWYASPSSAERLAPAVLRGLADADPPVHLYVRSPRPWTSVPRSPAWTLDTDPIAPAGWHRRFASAELRIVTGSRTLLEGLELGAPFLYFNGLLGQGSRARRHRPEKIVAFLSAARSAGGERDLVRDLGSFAAGRRVADVVRRAAGREGGWRRFSLGRPRAAFRPPYDDAGDLLVAVARALAVEGTDAVRVVERARSGSMT